MKASSINHIIRLSRLTAMLCCFFVLPGFGQRLHTKELGMQSDNDAYLFINQDQYYTNGIAFFMRGLKEPKLSRARQAKQLWEIGIGHKLYNPYNGYAEYAYMDRPFTAYLYVNGKNSWIYQNESVFSLAVELGAYGKAAFGKWLQEGFHHLFGFYKIQGWDYQLRGSVTVDLRLGYTKLLWRNRAKSIDLQGSAQVSLGLNQNYGGLWPTLRLGRINPLFESATTKSRLNLAGKAAHTERYFYYTPRLYYRVYDASIQGGMLLADKGPVTFGIKPWVFSQNIGFVYAKNRITFDAHLVFNTREVESIATAHQYASLALTYAL